MLVSESRVHDALKYLATTDEEMARLKGLANGLDAQTKTIYGLAFLDSEGKSVAEREARARTSAEYIAHLSKVESALIEFEAMRNKRNTEATVIEVWRSENANRRVGNV